MIRCLLLLIAVVLSSCGTTYYVVRHAEKEATAAMSMTTDVPLSAAGRQRAEALKAELRTKKIQHIYSTNTIRTMATARPLSEAIAVPVQQYAQPDSALIAQLKNTGSTAILIVGHSNTVDDIVNAISGRILLHDLPDSEYGRLYVIKRKGDKTSYKVRHFGALP